MATKKTIKDIKEKLQKPKKNPPQPSPGLTPGAQPFAAKQYHQPHAPEVRLVVDDKSSIIPSEIGKKRKSLAIITLTAGIILGSVLGYSFGTVIQDRRLHNLALRDAKEIYQTLTNTETTLQNAQNYADKMIEAAMGNKQKSPKVDYRSIQQLRSLKQPFSASAFSNRNYNLFAPDIVDNLFKFYQKTNEIWSLIQQINTLTIGKERKKELDDSAAIHTAHATSLIGCTPFLKNERYQCSLGFIRVDEKQKNNQIAFRSSLLSRRETKKYIYTGKGNLKKGKLTILVNNELSQGVLGNASSLFNEYKQKALQLKTLLDESVEIKQRVKTHLDKIAAQSELKTL